MSGNVSKLVMIRFFLSLNIGNVPDLVMIFF